MSMADKIRALAALKEKKNSATPSSNASDKEKKDDSNSSTSTTSSDNTPDTTPKVTTKKPSITEQLAAIRAKKAGSTTKPASTTNDSKSNSKRPHRISSERLKALAAKSTGAVKQQAVKQQAVKHTPQATTPVSATPVSATPVSATTKTVPTKTALVPKTVETIDDITETVEEVAEVQRSKDEINFEDLNESQRSGVLLAGKKESYCLIGSAGSGKTTTVRSVATHLADEGIIHTLLGSTKKVLRHGAPSIAILSYTNQAVRNIKEALPSAFKRHCSTVHMILEYAPEFYTDTSTGVPVNKMKFAPTYGTTDYKNPDAVRACKKLPHLDMVVVEESGSVPLDLWNIFLSALPNPDDTTFIFLGDLNQLPPVFDDAVLGFSLLDLPTVELTQVYRNVGLVTQLAHRILSGKPMLDKECDSWNKTDDSGTIRFMRFPKIKDWEHDLAATGASFKKMALAGKFNPDTDVCLVPFNVKFGAVEMNKYILQGITEREDKEVWQVRAGFNEHYFCTGDRVLFDKQYYYITELEKNDNYFGEDTLPPSRHIDRWGNIAPAYRDEILGYDNVDTGDDIELLLSAAGNASQEAGIAKRAASHVITLEREEEGTTYTIKADTAGEINNMLHTAAMTVHKAQGSEFQHVYMVLHHSHSVMINREILYTGITRSRRDLTIIYSGQNPAKPGGSIFQKGIMTQQIAGTTVDDKLKHFKAKRKAEEVQKRIKMQKQLAVGG